MRSHLPQPFLLTPSSLAPSSSRMRIHPRSSKLLRSSLSLFISLSLSFFASLSLFCFLFFSCSHPCTRSFFWCVRPCVLFDRWMINPRNQFRMAWDLGLIMPFLVYLTVVMPFRLCFANEARYGQPVYFFEFTIDMVRRDRKGKAKMYALCSLSFQRIFSFCKLGFVCIYVYTPLLLF